MKIESLLRLRRLCSAAAAILFAVTRLNWCATAGNVTQPAPVAHPTFTEQVAPIIFKNCVSCHRPGEAAPFSLMTYDQVRKHARQITEVTGTKFMPPWHAEAGHVAFLNPRVLPDAVPAPPGVFVRFWGVRGSIPAPGPATVRYGGNTSCVEVRADGEIIILDSGTGIRALGLELATEFQHQSLNLTLLITHSHWDHVQGFPFFRPAYDARNNLRILGFEGAQAGLAGIFSGQMESPYFPIGLRQLPGHLVFEELKGMTFSIGPIQAQAAFMNHPGVAAGYRLNTSAGAVAYLPDNEPFVRMRSRRSTKESSAKELTFARAEDDKIVRFVEGVEVLIQIGRAHV